MYVKESKDVDFERHVIGPSCTLDFSDDESEIQGIFFMGIHLEEATDAEKQRDDIPNNKYVNTGITLYSLDGKENLIKNGVYSLADTALKAIDIEEPDGVIVDEKDENIENTGRRLLNNLARINSISYDKENSELTVNHNQVEPVLTSGEDYTSVESVTYTSQESLAATYYRLLAQHDYDKEFAIIIEEIINSATKYIWYNNQWHIFTEDHDLICPVEGLIDYYCEIMKGNYV